ncbi:cyclic lactone autoinducer peptide [Thermodesulfitimonas autotrophica]
MKRLLHRLLPALFSLLVAAAFAGIKPTCFAAGLYQPEVPEALRNKMA